MYCLQTGKILSLGFAVAFSVVEVVSSVVCISPFHWVLMIVGWVLTSPLHPVITSNIFTRSGNSGKQDSVQHVRLQQRNFLTEHKQFEL